MSFKVKYRPTDSYEFELDCRNGMTDLFEEVGHIQEVLGSAWYCCRCKNTKTRLVCREVEKFKYWESHCLSCGAKLSFGLRQDGKTLYPRKYEVDPETKEPKKDADGNTVWLPNNGWVKWNPKTGKNE